LEAHVKIVKTPRYILFYNQIAAMLMRTPKRSRTKLADLLWTFYQIPPARRRKLVREYTEPTEIRDTVKGLAKIVAHIERRIGPVAA
jgi:hypothetical protein